MTQSSSETGPMVRHQRDTEPLDCPYGRVRRIITAGDGGIANVHVVTVTRGDPHVHLEYDEVYYLLSGVGEVVLDGVRHGIEPGSVVVIPSGTVHSIVSRGEDPLEFIIFGTPAMAMDDPGAIPRRPGDA